MSAVTEAKNFAAVISSAAVSDFCVKLTLCRRLSAENFTSAVGMKAEVPSRDSVRQFIVKALPAEHYWKLPSVRYSSAEVSAKADAENYIFRWGVSFKKAMLAGTGNIALLIYLL